jgi:hypothetical protein
MMRRERAVYFHYADDIFAIFADATIILLRFRHADIDTPLFLSLAPFIFIFIIFDAPG